VSREVIRVHNVTKALSNLAQASSGIDCATFSALCGSRFYFFKRWRSELKTKPGSKPEWPIRKVHRLLWAAIWSQQLTRTEGDLWSCTQVPLHWYRPNCCRCAISNSFDNYPGLEQLTTSYQEGSSICLQRVEMLVEKVAPILSLLAERNAGPPTGHLGIVPAVDVEQHATHSPHVSPGKVDQTLFGKGCKQSRITRSWRINTLHWFQQSSRDLLRPGAERAFQGFALTANRRGSQLATQSAENKRRGSAIRTYHLGAYLCIQRPWSHLIAGLFTVKGSRSKRQLLHFHQRKCFTRIN